MRSDAGSTGARLDINKATNGQALTAAPALLTPVGGRATLTRLALAAAIFGVAGSANAATKTWVGTTSDFAVGSNWTAAGAPAPGDVAVFGAILAQQQPQLTDTRTITTMNFAGSWTLGSNSSSNVLSLTNLAVTSGAVVVDANLGVAAPGAWNITTGQSITINGKLSGSGKVTFGANSGFQGVMKLAGDNSAWSGGYSMGNSGTLQIAHAGALGTGTFTAAQSAAKIDNASGGTLALNTSTPFALNGGISFAGTNSLDLGNGAVTLGATAGIVVTANTLTFGGNMTDGASTFGITKTGSGTLVFKGQNTIDGAITLSAGALQTSDDTAYVGNQTVGGGLGSGAVTMIAGTSLQLRANGTNDASSQVLNYGNAINASGFGASIAIDVDRASGTGTGKSLRVGTLTLTQGGSLAVTGGNNYALNIGTLNTAFPSGGDTVNINASTGRVVIDDIIAPTPTVTRTQTVALNLASAGNRIDGTISDTVSGSFRLTRGVAKLGAGELTVSGQNTHTGGTAVRAGKLSVNASNTGTTSGPLGPSTIAASVGDTTGSNDASLLIGTAGSSGGLTISNPINIVTGSTGNQLFLGGQNTSGTNTLSGNITLGTAAAGKDLTLVAATGGQLDVTGNVLRFGGSNSLLTINDASNAGKVRLTGTSTYTGGTLVKNGRAIADSNAALGNAAGVATINGGTLEIAATRTITNPVTLTSGALIVNGTHQTGALTLTAGTVGGDGTITGALTIGPNLTISPGNSPGDLNTGAETWNGGGSYLWEINDATGTAGTNWDLLNIGGTLTLGATSGSPFTVNVAGLTATNTTGAVPNFSGALSWKWLIADAASSITYDSTSSADIFAINTALFTPDNANSGNWLVQRGDETGVGGDATQLYLTYTLVPEPAALGLVGIASALLLGRRRRSA